MFKPREPRMFWEYCHCMPLSCLYYVEIGKSMTAGSLWFVEVVLISRVHAISWVFSSIGFRIDVRTIFAFTNSMRFNLWTSGWHVVCRQRPSKNIQETVLASTIWPWNPWIKPRNLATLGFGMLWNSLVSNPCRCAQIHNMFQSNFLSCLVKFSSKGDYVWSRVLSLFRQHISRKRGCLKPPFGQGLMW